MMAMIYRASLVRPTQYKATATTLMPHSSGSTEVERNVPGFTRAQRGTSDACHGGTVDAQD